MIHLPVDVVFNRAVALARCQECVVQIQEWINVFWNDGIITDDEYSDYTDKCDKLYDAMSPDIYLHSYVRDARNGWWQQHYNNLMK
jgi:hypothetical protein